MDFGIENGQLNCRLNGLHYDGRCIDGMIHRTELVLKNHSRIKCPSHPQHLFQSHSQGGEAVTTQRDIQLIFLNEDVAR